MCMQGSAQIETVRMTMVKAIVLVFCAIVAAGCGVVEAQDGGWRKGRGTFYGNEPWLWDIHK